MLVPYSTVPALVSEYWDTLRPLEQEFKDQWRPGNVSKQYSKRKVAFYDDIESQIVAGKSKEEITYELEQRYDIWAASTTNPTLAKYQEHIRGAKGNKRRRDQAIG